LGEKGAWAYPGTAQIFSVPPIISGTRRATNFKFGRYIHTVHANKMPLKICEKRVRGRTQGRPKFLQYPYYLRKSLSYEVQIWQIYSQRTCEQKPFKHLREKGAWAYPGTAQIFSVPPIISGTRRATKFKFGRYIHRVYASKSLLQIWEKRARWRIQGLPKFFQYPLLFQEWVKLRSSSLAGIFTGSMQTKDT